MLFLLQLTAQKALPDMIDADRLITFHLIDICLSVKPPAIRFP